MSAQITEAHRELCRQINTHWSTLDGFAQRIADSEAKAVEQANAQVESLLSAAKNAIPASEHPAEPTVQNWAWQIRNLGDDRRLVYADRDKLRAEVKLCRATYTRMKNHTPRTQDVINRIADNPDNLQPIFDHARRLESELNAAKEQLRTEANRRKEAEAELAAERARLDWLMAGGVCMVQHTGGFHVSRLHCPVSRAAIDAAMKEGA